jgi:hypothetical protein
MIACNIDDAWSTSSLAHASTTPVSAKASKVEGESTEKTIEEYLSEIVDILNSEKKQNSQLIRVFLVTSVTAFIVLLLEIRRVQAFRTK